jgi:hypothetical protein
VGNLFAGFGPLEKKMRTIWLALIVIQFGLSGAAVAQDSSESYRSIGEKLPLF